MPSVCSEWKRTVRIMVNKESVEYIDSLNKKKLSGEIFFSVRKLKVQFEISNTPTSSIFLGSVATTLLLKQSQRLLSFPSNAAARPV